MMIPSHAGPQIQKEDKVTGGALLSSLSQSSSRRDNGGRAEQGRACHHVVADFLLVGWSMMFHPPPLTTLYATLVSGIDLLNREGGDEVAVAVYVRIEQEGDVRLPNGPVCEGPSECGCGLVRLGHDDNSAGATVNAVHRAGEKRPRWVPG